MVGTKAAIRFATGLTGIALLASCHLWPGTTPPPTSSTLPNEALTSASEAVSARAAAQTYKMIEVSGKKYRLKSTTAPEIIAYYPDGSPQTARIDGWLTWDGGVEVAYGFFYWDTPMDWQGNIDLCGEANLTSNPFVIPSYGDFSTLRGTVDFFAREIPEWQYYVNNTFVGGTYTGAPGMIYSISDPAMLQSLLQPGQNTLRIFGKQDCYTCTRLSCADYAWLGAHVTLDVDIPPPPSPTPEPSILPTPDPTPQPSNSPSATPTPTAEPSPEPTPSPSATPTLPPWYPPGFQFAANKEKGNAGEGGVGPGVGGPNGGLGAGFYEPPGLGKPAGEPPPWSGAGKPQGGPQPQGRWPEGLKPNELPKNAQTFRNPQAAFQHLKKYHGIDPKLASERLHQIKEDANLRPNDNVLIDKTGNVYSQTTGEYLGSLTMGGSK